MPSEDRIRQVATTKLKYGDDHYKNIGGKGGENSPSKFTSESGSKAAQSRWAKQRLAKLNKEKGQTNE